MDQIEAMDEPLPPELMKEVTARAKKQLRGRMRATLGAYPAGALRARSERIVETLLSLPEVQNSRGLASFWPMVSRGEVDLRPLDEALRGRGVPLFYPFMDPTDSGFVTGFRKTSQREDLQDRGRRFWEPDPSAPIAGRGEVDVVIVPALAAALTGHRIGYGAGYYDATLGDLCPPARAIIVAYEFQLLSEIPHEAHDRACDLIVTDRRVVDAETA